MFLSSSRHHRRVLAQCQKGTFEWASGLIRQGPHFLVLPVCRRDQVLFGNAVVQRLVTGRLHNTRARPLWRLLVYLFVLRIHPFHKRLLWSTGPRGEEGQGAKTDSVCCEYICQLSQSLGTAAELFHSALCKLEGLSLCGLGAELLIMSFTPFFAHFMALSQRLSQRPHL